VHFQVHVYALLLVQKGFCNEKRALNVFEQDFEYQNDRLL
jgi:hypothetical protein